MKCCICRKNRLPDSEHFNQKLSPNSLTQLVIIKKVNKPHGQFIAMSFIQCLTKIGEISSILVAIDAVIISKPVFIGKNKTAAITEIPGKKCICIKVVHILNYASRIGRTGDRISFFIKKSDPVDWYRTPVMPYAKRQVDTGSKTVDPGK